MKIHNTWAGGCHWDLFGKNMLWKYSREKTRQDPRNEKWWEMEEILWAASQVTLGLKSQMFAEPEEKISQSSSNEIKTAARQERSSADALTHWGTRICSQKGWGLFATGWEGWRRKGEHRSVIGALKHDQRRSLSKESSQMIYKMGF